MGIRRKAREAAVQILYQLDVNPGLGPVQAVALFFEHFEGDEEARAFAGKLVDGVVAHREEIDAALQRASQNWRIERMARVDRNILRLAMYELLHLEDIPPRVTLNEAIEIAKRYGAAESAAFVNGVLDRALVQIERKDG